MENVKIKTKITNFSNLLDSICQQHRSHYSREEAHEALNASIDRQIDR